MPRLQDLRQKSFEPRWKENDTTSAFLPFLCVRGAQGNAEVQCEGGGVVLTGIKIFPTLKHRYS